MPDQFETWFKEKLAQRHAEQGEPGRALFTFCRDIVAGNVPNNKIAEQPHLEMCRELESAMPPAPDQPQREKQTKLLFLAPRGTLKTTIASLGLTLQAIGENPNIRILLDSHTHETSVDRLTSIKHTLQTNQAYIDMYGDLATAAPKWAEDSIIIPTRTMSLMEPTIDTSGVNGAKTGGHYDLIIADDLVSENNYGSEKMRNKTYQHIMNLYPLLNPGGTLVVIGTRWHMNDAYGRILKTDAARGKKKMADEWRKLVRGPFLDDGTLYAPTLLTEEVLLDLRESLPDRLFAVWYLNQPREESDKMFPRSQHRYYDGDFHLEGIPYIQTGQKKVPVYVTMAWDPAGPKPGGRSDFHGITVVGTDETNRWWVLEGTRHKGLPDQILDRVIGYIITYQPIQLSVEVGQAMGLWITMLKERLAKLHISISISEHRPGRYGSKLYKIEGLQPKFKQGLVYLRRGMCEDLASELEEYPDLDHEDVLDSLFQHTEIAKPVSVDYLDEYFEQLQYEEAEGEGDREDEEGKIPLQDGTSTGAIRRKTVLR